MNNELIPSLVDYSSDEEQCHEYEINSALKVDAAADYSNEVENNRKDNTNKQTYIQEKLPLPSEIKCMYENYPKDVVTDDPEKHGGKIRSFPHERGVWATYVYVPYEPLPEFLKMIEDLKSISKKHRIDLDVIEDFHVSLSKTLKLRYHWIQMFVDALKLRLKTVFKFKIIFQSLEVYENEEKTRTFLGMKVYFGYDSLCKIIEKVDTCLTEFKLPLFYKNPSFHLSCASCAGSKSDEIELFMADLNAVFQTFAESDPMCRSLWVKNIHCKSGNKLFTLPLKS